jgi:predicted RNA-binding protein YlqC (UPF0109 family)
MEYSQSQTQAHEILQAMLIPLCDHPEKCIILGVHGGAGTEFKIQPHKDDIGKIIGPGGNTIRAIRTYMMVLGLKQGMRYTVKFDEGQEHFYLHRN